MARLCFHPAGEVLRGNGIVSQHTVGIIEDVPRLDVIQQENGRLFAAEKEFAGVRPALADLHFIGIQPVQGICPAPDPDPMKGQ